MGLTNAYRDFICQVSTSSPSAPTLFNAANAYVGVGSSSATFSATHTQLLGQMVTGGRRGMEQNYPTASGNTMTFRALFTTGDANDQPWWEWGVFNAATNGTMMNRKAETSSLGTKTSAQSWQMTVTLTVTVA